MSVDELGRFFSVAGLGVVCFDGWSGGFGFATGLRFGAMLGEVLFFWTPWRVVGAGVFAVAASVTVYRLLVARSRNWNTGRSSTVELVELVAWLWVLAALR